MAEMTATVAFGKIVRVGDCICYPVFARGEKKMKRIRITEITEDGIRGYDLDDHLHRHKTISNLKMCVLNADE